MTDDTKSRPLVLGGFREWWEWRHKGLAIREAMEGDPASVYAGMAAWDAATRAERERCAGVCDGYAAVCRRVNGPGDDQAAACLERAAAAIRRGPEPTEGV